ncbi:MAG: hypothetical protein K9J74_08645 [Sulfuritalea sp.]|nr:hypothetical protein [Sulfuritalea sp.]
MRETQITAFGDWLVAERGLKFAYYDAHWRWSVDDLAGFWSAVWDYFAIPSPTPRGRVLACAAMPGAQWFPGERMNYVDQVFRHATLGFAASTSCSAANRILASFKARDTAVGISPATAGSGQRKSRDNNILSINHSYRINRKASGRSGMNIPPNSLQMLAQKTQEQSRSKLCSAPISLPKKHARSSPVLICANCPPISTTTPTPTTTRCAIWTRCTGCPMGRFFCRAIRICWRCTKTPPLSVPTRKRNSNPSWATRRSTSITRPA